MLVGPSITLEELEKHLKNRLYEIRMEIPKLDSKYSKLREEFDNTPKVQAETKYGTTKEVVNSNFVRIPKMLMEIENEIKDLQNQEEVLLNKIGELETIEERSRISGGRIIDKTKEIITLTLKDCLDLNIDIEEINKHEVE